MQSDTAEREMIVATVAVMGVLIWALLNYEPKPQARPVRVSVSDRKPPRR